MIPSVMAKMGTEEDGSDPSVARHWHLVVTLGLTQKYKHMGDHGDIKSRFKMMLDALAFRLGIG